MLTTKGDGFLSEVLAALSLMTESTITEGHMETSFADLGVDSLMALELVVRLERQFGLVLSDDEIRKLRAPADLISIARDKGVL